MKQLVYFVVLTTVVVAVHAQYCNLKSCATGQHTVCLYPSPNPSSRCTQLRSTGITDQERANIVNLHNQLRAKVASGKETRGATGVGQPAASNMGSLTWDNELASIAQRWANQCNYGHDKCRNVNRFSVGQNVAYIGSTGGYDALLTTMVQSWYDEVKVFDPKYVDNYQFQESTGHYTQIVWANTNKIGCGAVRYKNGKWYTTYLVCNYGPAGNYIGQPIYKRL